MYCRISKSELARHSRGRMTSQTRPMPPMPVSPCGVGEERDVVDGVRPGVVEVVVETVRHVLLQGDQQTVVVREACAVVERVLRELRGGPHVVRRDAGDGLDEVAEVAVVEQAAQSRGEERRVAGISLIPQGPDRRHSSNHGCTVRLLPGRRPAGSARSFVTRPGIAFDRTPCPESQAPGWHLPAPAACGPDGRHSRP